jgi:hypothetical protein
MHSGPQASGCCTLHPVDVACLDAIRLERSRGFRRKEINRIGQLIEEHQKQLLEGWNEFFGG